MKYAKFAGTGLTCIGFLYLIVHLIGGKSFGISESGMKLFLTISLASLVMGNLLLLWYYRNDRKNFRQLLYFILFLVLFGLALNLGARL